MVKLFGLLQGQQKSLNHADITAFPKVRTSKIEVPSKPTAWVKISFNLQHNEKYNSTKWCVVKSESHNGYQRVEFNILLTISIVTSGEVAKPSPCVSEMSVLLYTIILWRTWSNTCNLNPFQRSLMNYSEAHPLNLH